MSNRASRRNNVIAGSFLILSLALAVFISILISDARERLTPTDIYYVRFSVAEGALGLKPGAPVTLAGHQVGRVTGVELARSPIDPSAGGPGVVPAGVDVQIRIRSDIALYENAMALLQIPLLGTMSVLNIASVGDGTAVEDAQGLSPLLEPGERLVGRIAPPAFLAQAGYGPEEVNQVRAIIDTAANVMERVDRVAASFEDQLTPTLSTARTAMEDVQTLTGRIRQKAPAWTESIDRTLTSADEAASRLGPIAQRAEEGVGEAREVLGSVQGLIGENRPRIDRTVAHVEASASAVRETTVPLLNETLAGARDATGTMGELAGDARTLLAGQTPNIERMLANLRLAADQFKLTAIEVRRNPWRLLYRPKTRELESEMLYDATRAYAEAVSDLRAASEALQTVSSEGAGAGVLGAGSPERIRAMTEEIRKAFEEYQEAERLLLERISEGSGG